MNKKICCLILLCIQSQAVFPNKPPKLTVVYIIDQFAYHYIPTLSPFFNDGLKRLLDRGINYTQAYFPHAMPATATGHAGLSTGTYAQHHGMVGNWWINPEGKRVNCDDDPARCNKVLNPLGGMYTHGTSSANLMVDTLSDQFVQKSKNNAAYALSLKSRAATCCAGKKGKAIWFDNNSGRFTSSSAYFQKLPHWLNTFNQANAIAPCATIVWHQLYPYKQPYAMTKDYSYAHARRGIHLINATTQTCMPDRFPKNPYKLYSKTPHANQLVLDAAHACIVDHLKRQPNDNLLVWISLSSLDKLGHSFGPNSPEVVDMIYRLDKQLGNSMRTIGRIVPSQNTLYVMTGDHGVCHIIEHLKQNGHPDACRIHTPTLIQKLNRAMAKRFGLTKFVLGIKNSQVYVDTQTFTKQNQHTQQKIIEYLKHILTITPGIERVWATKELQDLKSTDEIMKHFKKQLYPKRSGVLSVQVKPYCMLTRHKRGTSHRSPYTYDTHVPLVMYQPGRFQFKKIDQKVSALQLANTLAEILEVGSLPTSKFGELPGTKKTP